MNLKLVEPVRGNRRVGAIFGLVFGIVGTGIGFLIALGGVLEATSTRARQGQSTGSGIGTALFGVVLLAAFVALAISSEHRLRRHQPAAQQWATRPAPALSATGRRQFTPVSAFITSSVFTIGAVVAIAGTFSLYGEGQRSDLVQHHGIEALASVISVSNHYHSSRHGGYYTSDMAVSLQPPVLGQSETTVRFPGRLSYQPGQEVSVLVDPRDASYSELPGSADTQSWEWIVSLLFGIFATGFAVCFWWAFVSLEQHRRSVRNAVGT